METQYLYTGERRGASGKYIIVSFNFNNVHPNCFFVALMMKINSSSKMFSPGNAFTHTIDRDIFLSKKIFFSEE